jgi:flavin reductase (DIM6/NTAB) family NADH-FMN oxidoreductase RutF
VIDAVEFRQALSRFAAGVTVITTQDASGARCGFTATAFSSVSLAPPLVLFCVGVGGRFDCALRSTEGFAVNVLDEDQLDVAVRFADRTVEDRFFGVPVRTAELALPVIEGALATIVCRRQWRIEAGDHAIYLGEVLSGDWRDGRPLLHFRGAFESLVGEEIVAEEMADFMVGAAW